MGILICSLHGSGVYVGMVLVALFFLHICIGANPEIG